MREKNRLPFVPVKTSGTFPRRIPWDRKIRLLLRMIRSKITFKPYVLHLEVTHRCNARCGHCACWRMKPRRELKGYEEPVRHFRPLILWLTGGEPLLRSDICEIVREIRRVDPDVYIGMSTNGWLLNKEMGFHLMEAGLDQINISIDFLGARHDANRKIEGLFDHIADVVPKLKSLGLSVVLTTSLMRENLNCLLPIANLAHTWGVDVGYSLYSSLKTGDETHRIPEVQLDRLRRIVEELLLLKKQQHRIKSSDTYLKKIPQFVEKGSIPGCRATKTWLYLAPDGYLKICPDREVYSHYKHYSGGMKISCGACWYTCRGEMETPIFERMLWEWFGKVRQQF